MRHIGHRASAVLAGAVVAALVGIGCGGDDDTTADTGTAADEPADSTPVATDPAATTPATDPPATDAADDDLAQILPDLGVDGAITIGELGVLMGEIDGLERRIVEQAGGNGLIVYGVAPAPGEIEVAGTAIESNGLLASLQVGLSSPLTPAEEAVLADVVARLGIDAAVLDPLLAGESEREVDGDIAVCRDDRPSLLFVPEAFPCG